MEGRIVIRSERANLQVVDEIVDRLRNCVLIDDDEEFKMRLVLTEAIQNAITHGNQDNPEKVVLIDYKFEPDKELLFFCITDQGKGFDLNQIADPTLPDLRDKEGGRGVYFLKTFTEHLSYCNEAKAIQFTLKVQPKQ
jgi:serine/threonine-protein kinase RsbW